MITNKYNITKLQNACENSAAEDVDLTITGSWGWCHIAGRPDWA